MRFKGLLTATLAAAAAALAAGAASAQNINCGSATQPCGIYGVYAGEAHYGSPNSLSFDSAAVALDLQSIQPEGADAFTPEGDADTIGGALTYFKAGFQKGERYEGRYQHQRRIGEGTRARFLLDATFNILRANTFHYTVLTFPITNKGDTQAYGTVSAGVELPARPNWLITPRVAYSNLQASQTTNGGDGELLTGSVTSRYKFDQIGRGDLVLGDMVAYQHTIKTFLGTQPYFAPSDFWTFRNGLAYQLPLKRRMFGRQASVRASYVFTYTTGEPGLSFKQIHELGVNVGVRTREAEQKNGFEQMRLGLLYTHGKNELTTKASYDAVTVTFGYRF